MRCPLPEAGPASLAAPSVVTTTATASLNEASLLATPLAVPPFDAPPLPLPDAGPLVTPEADSSPAPELEPVATLPLPSAEPAPDAVVEAPLPAPPEAAPLAPFWAGPGPVWLALHAATTKAAQNNQCGNDVGFTSISVEVCATFDHPAELSIPPARGRPLASPTRFVDRVAHESSIDVVVRYVRGPGVAARCI